jgi:hypothetical protein
LKAPEELMPAAALETKSIRHLNGVNKRPQATQLVERRVKAAFRKRLHHTHKPPLFYVSAYPQMRVMK